MDYACVRPNDCMNYMIDVKKAFCDSRSTCRGCALSTKQGCSLLKAMLCFIDIDESEKIRVKGVIRANS